MTTPTASIRRVMMVLLLVAWFPVFASLSAADTIRVAVAPQTSYQTVEGFGASDCWDAGYVGQYFSSNAKKNAVAKLFSQNLDDKGNPTGIGLSIWRVNVGAGSASQGKDSGIEDEMRRTECFLSEDGTYDWNRQSGQQYFMRMARQLGCENFVLFSNSAPIYFTKNGKAVANESEPNTNLSNDRYDDFAEFLATVAKHFEDDGYHIQYVSPVNEPSTQWSAGQEGSPWQNSNIASLVREMNKSFKSRSLSARILIPEADAYPKLCGESGRARNQLNAFWNKNESTYLGNQEYVAPLAAGHSYWTFSTDQQIKSVRETMNTSAAKYGIGTAQTEWCALADAPDPSTGFPGYEKASYMDMALFMAKIIQSDLVYANAVSWCYWTALSREQYGQKNRFYLMRIRPTGGDYASLKNGGTVEDNPNLWTLGNFSLFIRPGYKRIAMKGAQDMSGVMGSAFLSPDGERVVMVYVNTSSDSQVIKLSNINLDGFTRIHKYVTCEGTNLRIDQSFPEQFDGVLTMPARSVTTFLLDKDPTAITTPSSFLSSSSSYHDLSGRKANTSYRGIIINNGRKILKK